MTERVVARLDELVSAVQPVDWVTTRYDGDMPRVYRVGARGGQAFQENLSVADGLEALLRGERMADSSGGADHGQDFRVVEDWVHHAARGQRLEAALPRVQQAWFRAVSAAHGEPPADRARLLTLLSGPIAELGISRAQADAALRGEPAAPPGGR